MGHTYTPKCGSQFTGITPVSFVVFVNYWIQNSNMRSDSNRLLRGQVPVCFHPDRNPVSLQHAWNDDLHVYCNVPDWKHLTCPAALATIINGCVVCLHEKQPWVPVTDRTHTIRYDGFYGSCSRRSWNGNISTGGWGDWCRINTAIIVFWNIAV